jgi:glucosamine-6-phosphate deaminase
VISTQVITQPSSVLGLATGSTVLGIYRQLIDWYERGDVDFSKVHTFNLDEYLGLAPEDKNSYHYYMQENFFRSINLPPDHAHIPDGMNPDTAGECAHYDESIGALGGMDLQLLGLGNNGHIGFNEPAPVLQQPTHLTLLSESTRRANARFFRDLSQVPQKAITVGIGTIMESRHILLCVSGAGKAEILSRVLTGPVTPQVPGSILQLHPNLTVIADEAALSML